MSQSPSPNQPSSPLHESANFGFPYHRPNDPVVVVPLVAPVAGEASRDNRRSSHGTASSGRKSSSENRFQPTTGEAFEISQRVQPSLRCYRRNFTIACTAFTVGAILIIASSPFSASFFVPGPLSSHHAPLAIDESGDRCATCHVGGNGSLTQWITSVFVAGEKSGITQSDLCMKCHSNMMEAGLAQNPHSIDAARLAEISQRQTPTTFQTNFRFSNPVKHADQLACSTCHREHHGNHQLTSLTDAQCQTCHGNTFHSFENGHPEFKQWPLQRRSRIAFDHSSHMAKHFPEKHKEFQCSQCHVDDTFQTVKKLASYEQTCAECHQDQIMESGSEGLALIALPMLDMEAIANANLEVGNWPAAATGDFDGAIPPLMRLLLSADPEAAAIFKHRGPDFGFADFNPEERRDVADAVTLVWSIKRLLTELAHDGPFAIQKRLQTVLGFEITVDQLERIATNLDGPVFQNAVKRWLPELLEPGLTRQSFDWSPRSAGILLNMAVDDSDDTSHDATLLAVNPLTKLMAGGSAAVAAAVQAPVVPDIAQPSEQTASLPELEETIKQPENPIASSPTESTAAQSPSANVASSNKSNQSESLQNMSGFTPPAANAAFKTYGWFRNDDNFSIRYRPTGHADDCLQAWIELVTKTTDANLRPETASLFERTISQTGIGLCRTCHTVDQLPDRSFAVNWVAEYRDPAIRSFTKFSHGPHLFQPELRDCSHCHEVDRLASNASSFLSSDAREVKSNFLPMTKSDCVKCHQHGRTNSHCTECHNYHVGSRVIGSK